jgi:4-hydroxythreonine-4-phosphate dehydrogenase
MTPHPRIALVLGDPAGIGPELIVKLLADEDERRRADVLLIADRDEVREAMRVAGCEFPFVEVDQPEGAKFSGTPLLYHYRGSARRPFVRAEASENGGRYSLETLKVGLELTRRGETDALCFAPLNKSSLHFGGMTDNDELHWFAKELGYSGPFCEFNVLDDVWTSRVTSHVALKDVPSLLSQDKVIEAIRLIDDALRQAGVAKRRIGVCGLNPHLGDHGAFGREEIDIIGPAVERARKEGLPADGPHPADTIFLKVFGEQRAYDAVVTMYHDQGQIALKLMGFWKGVTVQGGLPIPITTPAHGTAFDIAGKGSAKVGPMRQAFHLACRMGLSRRTRAQP